MAASAQPGLEGSGTTMQQKSAFKPNESDCATIVSVLSLYFVQRIYAVMISTCILALIIPLRTFSNFSDTAS